MIILRRIAAVFLALVFVVLLISFLLVSRVNSTAGSPNFYIDQLRRADIYNFLYTDVLPGALERTEIGGSGFNLSWARPQVLVIARQTVPPEWLQAQTEKVITAVVPYVLGDTGTFTVSIPLRERVQAGANAIKSTLHQDGVITRLYDQAVDSFVGGVPKGLPLSLTATEVKSMVRTIMPPDWVLKQLDNAVDEVVPYFTKDKEHFALRVNLLERQDALKTASTDILKRPETYDYIVREVITRPITQNLQQASRFGVTLTSDEVASAVKQALPLDWYQARVPGIVDQVFAYISGARQTLDITIPIADRKPAIVDAMGRLIAQKLGIQYDSLPALLRNLLTTAITSAMPDQIQLTEAQLVGSTGGDSPFALARKWLQQGVSYTDQDLRNSMGANQGQLDNVRQWLSVGFTFTEKDFSNWTNGGGGGGAGGFDSVRSTIGTVRRWLAFAWLIPALLLVAIGLLGGRRWSSKLMWASAVLAVATFAALIIFGPMFSAVVQPGINVALTPPAGQADALEAMLVAKGASMVQNAIGTFVGGLRTQAIILLVVALGLIVLGAIWHWREKQA